MSISITELLPAIAALSPADKVRLVPLALAQLEEDGVDVEASQTILQSIPPETSLRGCLKHYADPSVIDKERDIWQMVAREKHERC